jgi:hypothetical protein
MSLHTNLFPRISLEGHHKQIPLKNISNIHDRPFHRQTMRLPGAVGFYGGAFYINLFLVCVLLIIVTINWQKSKLVKNFCTDDDFHYSIWGSSAIVLKFRKTNLFSSEGRGGTSRCLGRHLGS